MYIYKLSSKNKFKLVNIHYKRTKISFKMIFTITIELQLNASNVVLKYVIQLLS